MLRQRRRGKCEDTVVIFVGADVVAVVAVVERNLRRGKVIVLMTNDVVVVIVDKWGEGGVGQTEDILRHE